MPSPGHPPARHLLLAALALALAGAGWRAGASSPAVPASAAPTAVAVVDFTRVYAALKEADVRAKRLSDQKTRFQTEVDDIGKHLDAMQADIDNAKAGSDTWVEARIRFQEEEIKAKARGEGLTQRLKLLDGNNTRELYLKFLGTLDFLAARDGWDLILLDDRAIPVPDLSPTDKAVDAIKNRKVLSVGPRADITDQVINLMNTDYGTTPPKDRSIAPPWAPPTPPPVNAKQ